MKKNNFSGSAKQFRAMEVIRFLDQGEGRHLAKLTRSTDKRERAKGKCAKHGGKERVQLCDTGVQRRNAPNTLHQRLRMWPSRLKEKLLCHKSKYYRFRLQHSRSRG